MRVQLGGASGVLTTVRASRSIAITEPGASGSTAPVASNRIASRRFMV
jgi:hypothetical protein